MVGHVRTPKWLEEMVSVVKAFYSHAFQNMVGFEYWGNDIDGIVGDLEELAREIESGQVKGLDF